MDRIVGRHTWDALLGIKPRPKAARTGSAARSSGSSTGYTIPAAIVQCESGGNYSAVNPQSGAGGAYQIIPSTWQAYGGQGLPQNAPKAEQDRIAAQIYARQGPAAWSC
jgi:muramidase (phage lysozyme)